MKFKFSQVQSICFALVSKYGSRSNSLKKRHIWLVLTLINIYIFPFLSIYICTEFMHSLAGLTKLLPARGIKRPTSAINMENTEEAELDLKVKMLESLIRWMHVSVFYTFTYFRVFKTFWIGFWNSYGFSLFLQVGYKYTFFIF